MKTQFEADNTMFDADAYTVRGYKGIAWHVLGWEMEADADTEWTGFLSKTGKIVAVMVGDDRRFTFDEDDLTPLPREEYCGGCGQVGCGHG